MGAWKGWGRWARLGAAVALVAGIAGRGRSRPAGGVTTSGSLPFTGVAFGSLVAIGAACAFVGSGLARVRKPRR